MKTLKMLTLGSIALSFSFSVFAKPKNEDSLICEDHTNLMEDDTSGCFYYENLCFTGSSETVAEAIEQQNIVWIDDEHELEDILVHKDQISLEIFDAFTFSDQDADQDEREAYIETYTINRCEEMK